MDPASIVGVVAVATQVIQTIHRYSEAVLACRDEVAGLRVELFCLKSALTQIERDSISSLSTEFENMLEEARRLLQSLSESLRSEASRAQQLAQRLTWPLKKQNVKELTTRLERLKTYFILIATNDTRDAARVAASSLRRIEDSVDDLKRAEAEKSRQAAVDAWLTTFDPRPSHNAALSARSVGTNAWLLDGALRDWSGSPKGMDSSQIIWIRGKPGSGKTCIAAACVSRLMQTQPQTNVVYFYCSYNNAHSQSMRTVVAWFVKHLSQKSAWRRTLVTEAYDQQAESQHGSAEGPADIGVLTLLALEICGQADGDIFFVIDAIDEMGEELEVTLKTLFGMARECPRLRLVLTSTESVAEVVRSISVACKLSRADIELGFADVREDINAYIDLRLSQERVLSKLRPQLRTQIQERLRSEHNGSFRWAHCTLDDLSCLTTPKAIKETLKGITPSLSNIYSAILQSIPDDLTQAARSMLLYLVSAFRQLTLHELAEAAVFSSHKEFDEDDRLIDPEELIRHLRSLVRYDPVTKLVELAHSSVRDFLTTREKSGSFHVDASEAKKAMCRLCVGYLLLPCFQSTSPPAELEERKAAWPFLEYATFWWAHHVRAITGELPSSVTDLASEFFASSKQDGGGNFAAWYQCAYSRRGPRTWKTKPLYICAREGLIALLKILLTTVGKEELEERGGSRGSTALHVAAAFGETEAMRLLLAAGADPNERNDDDETGLQWASFWGHLDTVDVLESAGAGARVEPTSPEHDFLKAVDGGRGTRRSGLAVAQADPESLGQHIPSQLANLGLPEIVANGTAGSLGANDHNRREPTVAVPEGSHDFIQEILESSDVSGPGFQRLHEGRLTAKGDAVVEHLSGRPSDTAEPDVRILEEEMKSRDFRVPRRVFHLVYSKSAQVERLYDGVQEVREAEQLGHRLASLALGDGLPKSD